MLTILFNQPGQVLPLLTIGYVAAKPAKPVPPRQRIALRSSMARTACGIVTLTLAEPPVEAYHYADGEDEEIAVLLFAMG